MKTGVTCPIKSIDEKKEVISVKFKYSCVDCPKPSELEYILDRSRPVTHDTFKRHVGHTLYKHLTDKLGYTASPLRLKDDYAVSYHKSKTPFGKIVYYIQHSAIEYVYY